MSRTKDFATGKPVTDGPEEDVRQEYEQLLHNDYGYSLACMDIEVRVQRGSASRERADLVIYETEDPDRRDQSRDIVGIVELKRPERKDG